MKANALMQLGGPMTRSGPGVLSGSPIKRLLICFGATLPFALTAACGQKGGLYLPPRNGTVVTRPAGAAGNPPQSTDQSTSPQDATTLPSTTTSESTPSGTLRQNTGPATQSAGPTKPPEKTDQNNSPNPQAPKK